MIFSNRVALIKANLLKMLGGGRGGVTTHATPQLFSPSSQVHKFAKSPEQTPPDCYTSSACSCLGIHRPHKVLFFFNLPKQSDFTLSSAPSERASTYNPVPTACQDDNRNRSLGAVCAQGGLLKKRYKMGREESEINKKRKTNCGRKIRHLEKSRNRLFRELQHCSLDSKYEINGDININH